MAEDRTQASITIKGNLDASLDKAFNNALKKVDALDKKLKDLGSISKKNASINESAAKSQRKLNDGMSQSGRLSDLLSGKFKGLISNVAKLAATYFTLQAASAAALGTIRKTAEFQGKMSQFQAVSGISSAELKRFKEFALTLGETTFFKASEAAQTMAVLSKAGIKSDSMKAIMPHAMNLALAGDLDLTTAAESMSKIKAQFGLQAGDAERITDVLVKTADKSVIDVSDILESTKHIGAMANILGTDLEKTAAFIGLTGSGGVSGGIATRALATRLANLAADDKGLREIGINIFKDDKFIGLPEMILELNKKLGKKSSKEKIGIIQDIFQDGARAVLTALNQGEDEIKDFIGALDTDVVKGYGQSIADIRADNLEGDLKALGSSLESLQLRVGEIFGPQLRGTVQDLTHLLRSMANGIRDNINILQRSAEFLGNAVTPWKAIQKHQAQLEETRKNNPQKFTGGLLGNRMSRIRESGSQVSMPVNINISTSSNAEEIGSQVRRVMEMTKQEMERVLKDSTEFSTVRAGL